MKVLLVRDLTLRSAIFKELAERVDLSTVARSGTGWLELEVQFDSRGTQQQDPYC